MNASLAAVNVEADCERVLRSLPLWFGQEDSVVRYVQDTSRLPTLITTAGDAINGFVTLRQHFPQSYEISCIAVHAHSRGKGCGRALLQGAADWASARGGRFLQVKTLAPTHPSPEYAQTRGFYERIGFVPLEIFPTLWSAQHPCLQMIKWLPKNE